MNIFTADRKENENPYFKAFRLARNINDGNHWQACDYMEWIDHKHRLFRAIHKINYPDNYLPLLEKHKELFVDWLFEIAKQEVNRK